MCKEVGAYPKCSGCPNFVPPDATPGVMTWEELLEHMDNLADWGHEQIKAWAKQASALQKGKVGLTPLGELAKAKGVVPKASPSRWLMGGGKPIDAATKAKVADMLKGMIGRLSSQKLTQTSQSVKVVPPLGKLGEEASNGAGLAAVVSGIDAATKATDKKTVGEAPKTAQPAPKSTKK